MSNIKIFNLVATLVLAMAVGFIAKKKKFINNEVSKGLSELILNITLPFLIVSSFNYNYSRDMLIVASKGLLLSFIIHTLLIIISKSLYVKYPNEKQSVLRFVTIFSNCGYMAYPFLESIYGKIGIFYGAIFNIPFNVYIWTVGVLLFEGSKESKNIKKAVLNPGLISVLIGLILFIFSIKLPGPILKTMDSIGAMTTPLSMMIIGSMLAESNIKDIFKGLDIYYVCIIRLIGIPLSVFIILYSLGIKGTLLEISTLIMAMPAAANTAVFSEKYGGDTTYASRCVFITTLLSIITLPVMMILIF